LPDDVGDDASLLVDPLGDEIIGASLSFYAWEGYDPEFHKSAAEYASERDAYNAAFDAAAELARGVLPPPLMEWTDARPSVGADAHRAMVWEGTHGLLILQQAAFDLQFGLELMFWLMGCSRNEFRPTTPLIEWLCDRSRSLHDKHGFPPLAR